MATVLPQSSTQYSGAAQVAPFYSQYHPMVAPTQATYAQRQPQQALGYTPPGGFQPGIATNRPGLVLGPGNTITQQALGTTTPGAVTQPTMQSLATQDYARRLQLERLQADMTRAGLTSGQVDDIMAQAQNPGATVGSVQRLAQQAMQQAGYMSPSSRMAHQAEYRKSLISQGPQYTAQNYYSLQPWLATQPGQTNLPGYRPGLAADEQFMAQNPTGRLGLDAMATPPQAQTPQEQGHAILAKMMADAGLPGFQPPQVTAQPIAPPIASPTAQPSSQPLAPRLQYAPQEIKAFSF